MEQRAEQVLPDAAHTFEVQLVVGVTAVAGTTLGGAGFAGTVTLLWMLGA